MAKRKDTKEQTTIYKALHIKLMAQVTLADFVILCMPLGFIASKA
jgi:hypothetical protein